MSRIREVWAPNLDAEMRHIRDMIDQYPFVAMVCDMSPLYPIASGTRATGHRVPRGRGKTYRYLQDLVRLPLPNHAVQRRPPQAHPNRHHTRRRGGQFPARRHDMAVQFQV